jgi:DNA-binding MarR family transcriptional regulator
VVSDRDRRARELTLTADGQQVLSALLPIVQAVQQDILHPLSDAERDCFVNLARKVVWQGDDASDAGDVEQKSSNTR